MNAHKSATFSSENRSFHSVMFVCSPSGLRLLQELVTAIQKVYQTKNWENVPTLKLPVIQKMQDIKTPYLAITRGKHVLFFQVAVLWSGRWFSNITANYGLVMLPIQKKAKKKCFALFSCRQVCIRTIHFANGIANSFFCPPYIINVYRQWDFCFDDFLQNFVLRRFPIASGKQTNETFIIHWNEQFIKLQTRKRLCTPLYMLLLYRCYSRSFLSTKNCCTRTVMVDTKMSKEKQTKQKKLNNFDLTKVLRSNPFVNFTHDLRYEQDENPSFQFARHRSSRTGVINISALCSLLSVKAVGRGLILVLVAGWGQGCASSVTLFKPSFLQVVTSHGGCHSFMCHNSCASSTTTVTMTTCTDSIFFFFFGVCTFSRGLNM